MERFAFPEDNYLYEISHYYQFSVHMLYYCTITNCGPI